MSTKSIPSRGVTAPFLAAAWALAPLAMDRVVYSLFRKVLGSQRHQMWAATAGFIAAVGSIAIPNLSNRTKGLMAVVYLAFKWYAPATHIVNNKDFLILRNALAAAIGVDVCIHPDETLDITTWFDDWIEKNQSAISRIEELNLSHSLLQNLPPQICHLVNLKKLNLRSNNLTDLPRELCHLRNLEELHIDANPLVLCKLNFCTLG